MPPCSSPKLPNMQISFLYYWVHLELTWWSTPYSSHLSPSDLFQNLNFFPHLSFVINFVILNIRWNNDLDHVNNFTMGTRLGKVKELKVMAWCFSFLPCWMEYDEDASFFSSLIAWSFVMKFYLVSHIIMELTMLKSSSNCPY